MVNIFIQIYPLCPSKYVETHLSKYTHCAPHRAHKICRYILWEFPSSNNVSNSWFKLNKLSHVSIYAHTHTHM